jgi:hypothetical protein
MMVGFFFFFDDLRSLAHSIPNICLWMFSS